MSIFGAEKREGVQQAQPTSQVARIVGIPSPPVQPSNMQGAMAGIQQITQEQQTLATVYKRFAPLGEAMFEKGVMLDFHEGQMAYQQGKAQNELGIFSSGAVTAGYMSMEAATAADAAYVKTLDEIDKGDKMLSPEDFRKKRTEAFKGQLTGNSMYDQYITRLNVDIDNKLARAHATAHTAYQTEQTMNSATNLLVSKSKVAGLEPAKDYGNRTDGTKKGSGWLGEIKMDNGLDVITELSAQGNINGKDVLYPLVVPTLSQSEVDHLKAGKEPTETIHKKAADFAAQRMKDGKSPFKEENGSVGMIDGFLNGTDSPLRNLSPEQQRKVVLDAVNESLVGESDVLFKHLGGVDGIREKYNPSAAEMSALEKHHKHYTTTMENKYNAEWERASHAINMRVLTGALTYEQGLSAIEKLSKDMGLGDSTLKGAAGKIAGLDQSRVSIAMAEARANARENAREQKKKDLASNALATNQLGNLNHEVLDIALGMQKTQIVKEVSQEGLQGPDAVKEMNTRYAAFLNKAGIVDHTTANNLTAVFNSTSNVVDDKGNLTDQAILGYQSLLELDKVNPGLAMQHLKTTQAKDMFRMARDLDESNEDTKSALLAAANTVQKSKDFDPDKLHARREEVRASLTESFTDSFKKVWGSVFDPSNFGRIADAEVDQALRDPVFIGRAQRLANARVANSPALTPKQVADAVAYEMQSTTSFIMGTMVSTPDGKNIYDTMKLPEFKNDPAAPHKAMLTYLDEYGAQAFGKQWVDTSLMRGSDRPGASMLSRVEAAASNVAWTAFRGAPRMDVRFTNEGGNPMFVVMPYLTDGTLGKAVRIDPAKVGEFYKKKHREEIVNGTEYQNTILNTMLGQ